MDVRGIRNQNPGNILSGRVKWQGEVGTDDKGFAIFDTVHNGLRATARLLLTYAEKYGLTTITGIVTRWAPPNENNTKAYIGSVAVTMNRKADEQLDLRNAYVLDELVRAITLHEQGSFPYAARELVLAVDDALKA